ncbi:MAG: hypothetical protein AABZ47_02530 [Planctomycetota bacterium]
MVDDFHAKGLVVTQAERSLREGDFDFFLIEMLHDSETGVGDEIPAVVDERNRRLSGSCNLKSARTATFEPAR